MEGMGFRHLGELGCSCIEFHHSRGFQAVPFLETTSPDLESTLSQTTDHTGVARYWFVRWYRFGYIHHLSQSML